MTVGLRLFMGFFSVCGRRLPASELAGTEPCSGPHGVEAAPITENIFPAGSGGKKRGSFRDYGIGRFRGGIPEWVSDGVAFRGQDHSHRGRETGRGKRRIRERVRGA